MPNSPHNLVATVYSPPNIELSWSLGDSYDRQEIDYSTDQNTWHVITSTYDGSAYSYSYVGPYNTRYYFRVRGYSSGWSGWSNTANVAMWKDSITDTGTFSDKVSDATQGSGTDIFTDTLSLTEIVADSVTDTDSITDTISLSDSVSDAVIKKTDIAYFLTSSSGLTFQYGAAYTSDNGVTIPATWYSKGIDLSDTYPQYAYRWKFLKMFHLYYVDNGTATVTVGVSTDTDPTWTYQTRTLGSGDGTVKMEHFYFMKTGMVFNFSISESSATDVFQWIEAEAEFVARGEHFEIPGTS